MINARRAVAAIVAAASIGAGAIGASAFTASADPATDNGKNSVGFGMSQDTSGPIVADLARQAPGTMAAIIVDVAPSDATPGS